MTAYLTGSEIAKKIADRFPESVLESNNQAVVIKSENLVKVLDFLKNDPDLKFNYLIDITSVDYYDHFEVVYQLASLELNHRTAIKTRCLDHEKPVVPSITSLWRGADFMEREIYDLMGIAFAGHPNLKRIVLWEGFSGHPLRKDYL